MAAAAAAGIEGAAPVVEPAHAEDEQGPIMPPPTLWATFQTETICLALL